MFILVHQINRDAFQPSLQTAFRPFLWLMIWAAMLTNFMARGVSGCCEACTGFKNTLVFEWGRAFSCPNITVAALFRPQSLGKSDQDSKDKTMTDRTATYERIAEQIELFNKKGVPLTEATSFQGDLEWDSLTVMDFVAAVEDEFDIIITMNMQAEIENVGQLVDAVMKLQG